MHSTQNSGDETVLLAGISASSPPARRAGLTANSQSTTGTAAALACVDAASPDCWISAGEAAFLALQGIASGRLERMAREMRGGGISRATTS